MTQYIKLTNGTPNLYTLRDLRNENPDLLFRDDPTNEFLSGYSMYPYTASTKPTYDAAKQVVERQGYAETDGTYGDVYAVRDKTKGELATELAYARERMRCSAVDGQLEIGEENWRKVLEYRDQEYIAASGGYPAQEATTWRERIVINGSTHWQRNSQEIQFIGYLVGFNEEQIDALFIAAALVEV
jgi:hypothetical protein